MIEELMTELSHAKTSDEILSYKPKISETLHAMWKEIEKSTGNIVSYKDIENMCFLETSMAAYYGSTFYKDCGFPFLRVHNINTINVIEMAVLFYSLQVLELLEDGFWNETSLCVYDPHDSLHYLFDHTDKIDFTAARYGSSLFLSLWFYFTEVITISGSDREISICYENGEDTFYLDDEDYEYVLDMIYKNFNGSEYACAIRKILGIYRIRFTKMQYILEYQQKFVRVACEYLCSIV